MNICLACYRGNPFCGGQGVYLYYLSRALAASGHRVSVLAGPPWPRALPWAEFIPIPNKNVWGRELKSLMAQAQEAFGPLDWVEFTLSRLGYCPEMLAFSLRAVPVIKRLAASGRLDVIHDVETLGYGLLASRLVGGVGAVSTVHHPLTLDLKAQLAQAESFRARYYNTVFYPLLMQGFVARRVDAMITSSRVGARALTEAFRLRPEKIRLVYTGVDTAWFRPDETARRDPREILFVGNAEDRRKGVRYLFEALSLLPKEVRLKIVDQGPPYKRYAAGRAVKSGVADRVTFTGRLTDEELLAAYHAAGVVVMPSLFEGFGLPAAEGMATAAPVIVSRAGSLPEVVGEDEEGGLLVPPRNPAALAEAIGRVLFDPALARQLGRQGRDRVLRLFSWERTAANTVAVYQETAKKKP